MAKRHKIRWSEHHQKVHHQILAIRLYFDQDKTQNSWSKLWVYAQLPKVMSTCNMFLSDVDFLRQEQLRANYQLKAFSSCILSLTNDKRLSNQSVSYYTIPVVIQIQLLRQRQDLHLWPNLLNDLRGIKLYEWISIPSVYTFSTCSKANPGINWLSPKGSGSLTSWNQPSAEHCILRPHLTMIGR